MYLILLSTPKSKYLSMQLLMCVSMQSMRRFKLVKNKSGARGTILFRCSKNFSIQLLKSVWNPSQKESLGTEHHNSFQLFERKHVRTTYSVGRNEKYMQDDFVIFLVLLILLRNYCYILLVLKKVKIFSNVVLKCYKTNL